MKKRPRKALIKAADKAFSLFVRKITKEKYGNLCPFCLSEEIQVCFHFITRAKYSVRWDPINAIGSCSGCNFRMEFDPHPFVYWYIQNHGLPQYEILVERSNAKTNGMSHKYSDGEIEEFIAKYS